MDLARPRTALGYVLRKAPLQLRIRSDRLHVEMVRVSELARRSIHNERLEQVQLGEIDFLHPIEFGTAKAAVRLRAQRLRSAGLEGDEPFLSSARIQELIPSVDQIQLAYDPTRDRYVTLQGVGRLTAVREALSDGAWVEVSVGDLDAEILEQLYAVREQYGSGDGDTE